MPKLSLLLVLLALLVANVFVQPATVAHAEAVTARVFNDSTTNVTAQVQSSTPYADYSAAVEDPGVRHSRMQLVWSLVEQFWGWAVLLAILITGLSPRLSRGAARLASGRLGSLLPYVILLNVILTLVDLPIAYYRGFVIEHDFGLSNQTPWTWMADFGKSFAITLLGNLLLFALVYLFIRRSPRRWWLYSASLVIIFSVVIAGIAPIFINPLFNKFEPLQDQALRQKILTLAHEGGIDVADVLQVDMSRQTKAANAYFTGIGPTQRIVLGDNLLTNFTDDEILTVVAHEMGHQVHGDLWRGLGVGALFFLVGFYVLYRAAGALVARFGSKFGFQELAASASLPMLVLLFSVVYFLAGPALNTYSRHLEHEADLYALQLTHKNEAYASALKKLEVLNVSDPNPPEWIEFLFYTHPSSQKRIEFALSYQRPSSPPNAKSRAPS
jgi:STE24 endopeptidase